MGLKAGLDLELLYKVIKDGAGTSRMFEVRGTDDDRRRLQPGDDESRCLPEGHRHHRRLRGRAALPDAAVRREQAVLRRGLSQGYAQQDTASVCAVLEQMAGNPAPHPNHPLNVKARKTK